ncbi:ABC-three component system protein [Marinobacter sp.]|uniref:ABC-three component system protein n=1 Tax=Marinobacter sp. TaxID=50741 RepID=UPI0035645256
MAKYAYSDLSDGQFEELVLAICQRLFGLATQGFAKGPDGGRDAKFVGTAEMYPSTSSPWQGTTIIQAKHTIGLNKSFTESDFFSKDNENCVIQKEIPRIQSLISKGDLDNYLLIANRRLTGNGESQIVSYISSACNLPQSQIKVCGIEQLESWLKFFREIPDQVHLDPVDAPLLVSPDDLAEVIQALDGQKASFKTIDDTPPTPRVEYKTKNEINNFTVEGARYWRSRFLKETPKIDSFLSAPQNSKFVKMYESTVDEFQCNIIAKRKDHQNFDEVLNHIFRSLVERDPDLRRHRSLTRAMLFYMYWNCDIGEDEEC